MGGSDKKCSYCLLNFAFRKVDKSSFKYYKSILGEGDLRPYLFGLFRRTTGFYNTPTPDTNTITDTNIWQQHLTSIQCQPTPEANNWHSSGRGSSQQMDNGRMTTDDNGEDKDNNNANINNNNNNKHITISKSFGCYAIIIRLINHRRGNQQRFFMDEDKSTEGT